MSRRHIVIGQTVNSTVVVMGEGVLVVDTSVDEETAREVYTEATKQGEVRYVINTHEHWDHLAGNKFFSCPIISTAAAREQMLAAPGKPKLPTLVFSQQVDLYLGEQVTLKHFGGHSPGSAVVYFPERKLLFTGDLVFANRMPYMGQANFSKWLAALAELESWDVEVVVPGHGPQGGSELLAEQRRWLENFIGDVMRWNGEGASSGEMLQRVLSQHEVPERWQPMVEKAIELILCKEELR